MRSLLLAIFVAAVPATAQDPAVADWIASHAIPLKTVEAGHGFDDMQPLKKIIGDARIVALGEATHGTREFFQLKHRMVEFLATEMGFTIFSIEANMPEAYRLNDYVLNGRGDPAELLRGMYFWTWNTNEVLAMIEWMRQFNQSSKGRIEFTGFDMQTPTVAYEIARDFVAKYDPDFTATIKKAPTNAINPPREYTSYTGTFPVADAAGKTIRLSANIKTLNVAGSAAIWWRADHNVDGQSRTSEFKNLGSGTPKGTTDWKHYQLEMKVPSDATNINFGLLLEGAGTAWFDEVALSIDGVPYSKASGFDLINTSKPAGSFQLAQGYSGRFETGQHEGAAGPALRITGTAVAPGAVTPKDAAAAWTGILQHMQSAREEYLTKGASAKDADWAIQNARIILQCMQMKSSQNSIAGNGARDRAMAENIQ